MRFRAPKIAPGEVHRGWVFAVVAQEAWRDARDNVIQTMIAHFQAMCFPMDYRILGPIAVEAGERADFSGSWNVRVVAPVMRGEDYWNETHPVT